MPVKSRCIKFNPNDICSSKYWLPEDVSFDYTYNTNSWFNIDSIYSKCSDSTKYNESISTSNTRCKMITLYPSIKQKNILLQWGEIFRQIYNLTVTYIENLPLNDNGKKVIPNMNVIRNNIKKHIYSNNKNLKHLIFKYKYPIQSLSEAVRDCLKAYKSAFKNLLNKNIKYFRVRYKRKSNHLSTIVINKQGFSKVENAILIKILGVMKSSSSFTGINKDCRIQYNSRTNKFIMFVPYEKVISTDTTRYEKCSLDPGMRTFQTVYTPSGNCYEICNSETSNQITNLVDRIHKKDKGNPSGYKRYRNRLREKLKNKVNDLHWKSARFLCKKFNTIVVGNMSTKSIVSNKLNLQSKTKNQTYSLAHYTFILRLKSKAEEFGCNVIIQDESYSSKTCGGCGNINEKLGSSKIFKCPQNKCNFICDRDVNASRNILIKSKV